MPDNAGCWYVLYTYSGYENKVKKNLEHRISTLCLSDSIFRVEVPTIPGRRFPCAVVVQMLDSADTLRAVLETPGATGMARVDP
ncbi:MAG: transcription termination/antitermination NusG family protein [Chloroflexia bacterium]